MDINVEPLDNGWLVVDRTTKGRKVFIDREKMMEYLNEILPATRDEQGFIDNLNDDPDDIEDVIQDAEDAILELFNKKNGTGI